MTTPTDTPPVEPPVLAPPASPPAPPTPPAQEKPETDWKAESRKWEKLAKDNKTAADKLAEFELAGKSEAEKLAARAEAAEKQLATVTAEALRTRVALEKGLPADLAERLRGDDADAMRADADTLLALVGKRSAGDVDQGARGEGIPGQWSEADMRGKTPAQIVAAKEAGLLDTLLHPPR